RCGNVDFSLQISVSGDSFVTEPGPDLDAVQEAVQRATNIRPSLSTGGGTSDARFIKNYCPVVEFGLVNKTIHAVNERVPVDDLHTLTRAYRAVLERYFDRGAHP
ncbi:MAG: M20/M25/M40 family metallo-hydrolase, partial [Pseudomonadota bacterium]